MFNHFLVVWVASFWAPTIETVQEAAAWALGYIARLRGRVDLGEAATVVESSGYDELDL